MTEAALQTAESNLGISIPAPLRSCFLSCNGGQARHSSEGVSSQVELLSLESVLKYASIPGFINRIPGYFPFLENNDSNPVCVCCKSPLVGYVVLVNHGDGPRLLFRSPEGFFRAAVEHAKIGKFFDTYELISEFDGPERTKEDMAVAQQLIHLATPKDTLDDTERTNALRFACDLLSDENVDVLAELLNCGNEYVREHVLKRLKRIPSAEAKSAINAFESLFNAFVERCANRLQGEGIRASIQAPYGQKTIRIDPGPIWLSMEVFYSEHSRTDFDDYLLERARFFIENRG